MSSSIQNIINSTNRSVKPQNEVPKQGSESRSSILPNMLPTEMGFFGSPYNPANAMKTPNQIGVRVGNSIGDVVNAVKGVGFYTDQIGFGAPSTGLTQGMPLKPLGVNYFIKTGVTCSNGAEMWEYIQGIPEGNAFGDKLKNVMSEMGLPPLKGLAPGMIEDAKNALDPSPLIGSLFGTGYPQCKMVDLPVGDAYGNISDQDTGESWISDPNTAVKKGEMYYQTKWVMDTDKKGNPIYLDRDQWMATPKTFNKDGTPIAKEGFANKLANPGTVIVVGVLCLLAISYIKK